MSLRHAPWEDAAEFTIGLRPLTPEQWLEGGEDDPAARKDPLHATKGATVWAALPGSEPGQQEFLEMVEAAVGRAAEGGPWPALYRAARLAPDDLCVMEHRDGEWRLTALSLCANSFFTAEQVIGKSLAELHRPVTGFQERLLARTARIFDNLREGMVLERRNWTLLNTDDMHVPSSAPVRANIPKIDPANAASTLFTRVERQAIRRMPRTGAIAFTIRTWITPLPEILANPPRRAAFANAWRSAPPEFRAYKGFALYDHLVEPLIAGT